MSSKTQELNDRLIELLQETGREDDIGTLSVEYRGGNGWFLVFDYPRHFHDDGEFLGFTSEVANKTLEKLI